MTDGAASKLPVSRSNSEHRSLGKEWTMANWLFCVLLVVVAVVLPGGAAQGSRWIPCYNPRDNRPQRCLPPFQNAAFNRPVEASQGATCGVNGPSEFCRQTSFQGQTKWCQRCDASDPLYSHPPSYLTDFNNNDNLTWWQSETMLYDIQHPNMVNLTLHLGKAFDITYVRLKFKSSRPESFAIYKRTSIDGDWIPYQFYSASCEETYRRQPRDVITADDETKALCTHEFSDISPLTDGSVAFSTLEGRPSAYNFDNSALLQEWVTATDIRIVLNRINTFGDEVFGDDRVLMSYYYAISDFAVGGRCKCNGHSSQCVRSTGQDIEQEMLVCRCEHNTDGENCETCKPFYNDRPWKRSTASDANECMPCDCNGKTSRCYFDEELYRRTGHGGHCLDCSQNTAGINCERCKDKFYRRTPQDRCVACSCDPTGSQSEQCDDSGRCRCKSGVTGEKCDRCMPNFFDFGNSGCRECQCWTAGCKDNVPECMPDTGSCSCKQNVEGQNCDRCKPGYFNLQAENEFGCISCFCYGHSSMCASAPGYTRRIVHSTFDSGRQRWMGSDRSGSEIPVEYNGITQQLGISTPGHDQVYFLAPARYLEDQRLSYNQMFSFRLTVGEEGARASILDVVLEGDGFRVSAPIFAQGNPQPRTVAQDYSFRLHEHPNYQWTPSLTSMEFQKMLANMTAIRIRGTYSPKGVGFIDDVKLESARQGNSGNDQISSVELCSCPNGYVGQFCESCAPGYSRDPPYGGPLARCVPCDCNGHSDACDVNSGHCICQHNTIGDNCERCQPGYYGYALAGTPDDCQQCPCPGNGECVELLNGEVACINCREGYTGNRCQFCADGNFGDPDGKYGSRKPCQRCDCNENIDPNAVANCNSTTGECLKCIYNTAGYFCDKCLPGYYGDALGLPKGQCKACNCYPAGSRGRGASGELTGCDENTGECSCLRDVVGKQCDQCREGYWNIDSGYGCEVCDCNLVGSVDRSCDIRSGQCSCKPGVTGRRCDQCLPEHFGFSNAGCSQCECNPEGSRSLQCDLGLGQCQCWPNVEGRACDRCVENKYNISAGCVDCPVCYNLVQLNVDYLRIHLFNLRKIISDIGTNPQQYNDTDFIKQIRTVNDSVNQLLEDAKLNSGEDSSLMEQFRAMQAAINDVVVQCGRITLDLGDAQQAGTNGEEDVTEAERLIDEAERALQRARDYMELEGKAALQTALEAQTKYGHRSARMTEISEEARQLADKQEAQAMQIDETAREALNTSTEALRIAREALQKPTDIARDIDYNLKYSKDISSLLNQTEQKAQEAKEQAHDAYNEALSIYSDADSIDLPDVDIDSLKNNAQMIKEDSAEIKQDAEELMDANRDLMEQMSQEKDMAEEMLENGIRQQQIADNLMSEADLARKIAREAVSKAEETLFTANVTLKTLEEFEKKVKEGKAKAEEAKKKIPDIEERITDAEDKTQRAQVNLEDAVENAIRARDIARLARDTAEMASEDAGEIKEETSVTKDRAFNLRTDSDSLKIEVDQAEIRLEGYEQQAEDDATLSNEALKKADEAKTSAEESSDKVENALSTVNSILDQLDALNEIDLDKLDILEKSLIDAETQMEEAQLQVRYEKLLLQYTQQKHYLFQSTQDLSDLQAAVENINQINMTIPRTCYNKPEIEPTFNPAG